MLQTNLGEETPAQEPEKGSDIKVAEGEKSSPAATIYS